MDSLAFVRNVPSVKVDVYMAIVILQHSHWKDLFHSWPVIFAIDQKRVEIWIRLKERSCNILLLLSFDDKKQVLSWLFQLKWSKTRPQLRSLIICWHAIAGNPFRLSVPLASYRIASNSTITKSKTRIARSLLSIISTSFSNSRTSVSLSVTSFCPNCLNGP